MSEIKTLEIPKWGLSMEEGTIAQWLIQEGEHFTKGQEICEIETTKIVNVLEAPFEGTLRKILAKNGDTLIVGGFIAVCAEPQVADAEIDAFVESLGGTPVTAGTSSKSETKTVTAATEKTAPVQAETMAQTVAVQNNASKALKPVVQGGYAIPTALQGYQLSGDVFATPHALRLAEKHNVDLAKITGSGRASRISVSDIQTAVIAAGGQWPDIRHQASGKAVKSTADDSQIAATPVARRLAKQWGINLHDCRTSGSRGRICKEDVEAVYARDNPNVSHTACESAPAPSAAVTTIAMNGMRRAIASRLQSAKRNAPHFRLIADLNVDAIQHEYYLV